MARLSITLPDDLYAQIQRIADGSHVSVASTVRAILSDIVPRTTSVMDYLGSSPVVTQADLSVADVWLEDLRALYDRAPETFRNAMGDATLFPTHVLPPEGS